MASITQCSWEIAWWVTPDNLVPPLGFVSDSAIYEWENIDDPIADPRRLGMRNSGWEQQSELIHERGRKEKCRKIIHLLALQKGIVVCRNLVTKTRNEWNEKPVSMVTLRNSDLTVALIWCCRTYQTQLSYNWGTQEIPNIQHRANCKCTHVYINFIWKLRYSYSLKKL